MTRAVGAAPCKGCARTIKIRAKGYCNTCYYRWLRLGRPDELPPARGQAWNRKEGNPPGKWLTVQSRSEAMQARLEDYRELAAIVPPLSQREIADRMGVSKETIRKYRQIVSQESSAVSEPS